MAATAVSPARRAGMPRMLDGHSPSSKFKRPMNRPIAPKPTPSLSTSSHHHHHHHHHQSTATSSSPRRKDDHQLANGQVKANGVDEQHSEQDTEDVEDNDDDDNDKGEGTSTSAAGPRTIMRKLGSAGNGMFDVATLLKEPLKFVPAKHADEGSQKLPYEPLPTGPLAPTTLQSTVSSAIKGKGPALPNGHVTIERTSTPVSSSSNRPAAGTSAGGSSLSSSTTEATTSSVHNVPLPKSWPQNFPVGPGYHNLGNTCFLNSTLQSLTHTAPLVACLMGEGYHSPKACKLSQNNKFCLLCAMQHHIRNCFGKNRSSGAFAPNNIVRRLTLFAKGMHVGRQEDAHEFLRFSLDAMQQSAAVNSNPPAKTEAQKESTFMHRIFGGKLRSRVTCMSCKANSDTFDSFMDLSLDVSRADSLREAFQAFIKVDMLQGANKYKCEKCKKLVVARKQFTINKAPQILHVHLKRFTPTGRKIVGHITYHEHMSLKEYMSEESDDNPNYRLYAVVCHSGQGPHSGHYFAHVRAGNNKWHCMNDSSVSEVQTSIACNQRNAYLLFYERVNRLGDAVGRSDAVSGQSKEVGQAVSGGATGAPSNGKRKDREEEDAAFPQQRVKLHNQPNGTSPSSILTNRPQRPTLSGPTSPLRQHTGHFSQSQTSPSSPKLKKQQQQGLFTQTGPVRKNPQFNRSGLGAIPAPAFFSTANARKPRRKSLHANMTSRPRG